MATPNMATITASLERSLQNCSLNHQHSSSSSSSSTSSTAAHGPDSPQNLAADAPSLELNSQASLPFHWEQCLDLKTGEIYYINWRTGMKAKEDPRATAEYGGGYYSEEDSSSYDSEGSSSESSPSSSREQWSGNNNNNNNNQENCYYQEKHENEENNSNNSSNVLVVAGCKSCLMYYMVPKQLEICPKCCGQLLHFDRSENGSS
ncbi:UNVERIFIED_CONTAM: hypothetical protein Scaly_1456800 [Sesamum calycinum]|uniref:WW domain-containing protein n=1 Tax=Sesamum calycinum TaxID=2727403 RepID=A0AAW2PTC0_9LAMI